MNRNSQKLEKKKMQKLVTEIEGERYLIYYSFTDKVDKKREKTEEK